MRDNFGMVDRRKNGGDQSEGFHRGERGAGIQDCVNT